MDKLERMKLSNFRTLDNTPNDPYKALANAIIVQAVTDYRGKKISYYQLKKFLLGEWFMLLSNVDGAYILERIEKDDSERIANRD